MKRLYLSLRCLLLLLAGLLFSTCKKQNPLPQNTETGKNTLGCLVDGKAYIPDGGGGWSGLKPIYGGFFGIHSTPYKVGIYIYTYAKDKQRIELFLNDFALGQHSLNYNTTVKPATIAPQDYGLYQASNGEQYVTSVKYTGRVNLTKADITTGIVAGTFEFQATTPDGKTVNITQGRFDVNARTQ